MAPTQTPQSKKSSKPRTNESDSDEEHAPPKRIDPKNPEHKEALRNMRQICKTAYDAMVARGTLTDGLAAMKQPAGGEAAWLKKAQRYSDGSTLQFWTMDYHNWFVQYCKSRGTLGKDRVVNKKNRSGEKVKYTRRAHEAIREGKN